jgi:TPP-dependent pyruvate/acetoin dehydrogenase alpha subunit
MTSTTTEQGTAELAGHQGFSIITNEKLRQLYISMVKCRMLAERLRAFAGPEKVETALGREAFAVGVLLALLPEDAVTSAPESFIACFFQNEMQGRPLELKAYAGMADSAAQFKLLVLEAQAKKKAKNGAIAVAFFSKIAGFPEKALKQASAKRLPILFVRQASVLSEGFGGQASGVSMIPVDGTDVVAVYRVATESITHARKGNGPTLIECFFDPMEASDPIEKMEAYLTRKGLFSADWKRDEGTKFTRKLDEAVRAANR